MVPVPSVRARLSSDSVVCRYAPTPFLETTVNVETWRSASINASVRPSATYPSRFVALKSSKYNTATCRGSSPPVSPEPARPECRRAHSAAPAATNATTARAGTTRRQLGRCARAPASVARRTAPVAADGMLSASANNAVVGYRSAGSFDSARRIAASTASGIVLRTIDGGETMSRECRASTACAVGPVKGGSPTSISYTTHARLY